MYCIFSLPRASSIAVYSWILESVSIKYPEYKECADILLNVNNPHIFKNVAEVFEEIDYHDPRYINVTRDIQLRDDLQQSLLPEPYWYSSKLYSNICYMSPVPIVSIKVGKTYSTLNKFLHNSKYQTITLARRDVRQQFLSFIVSTQSQTYHGDQQEIYIKRSNMKKIIVTEDMFIVWFDWLCKLHRAKQLTDHVFYVEDYTNNPGMLLRQLNLPEIHNYSRIIQKTKDTHFVNKIENLNEFDDIWNQYCSIYKDIL